MPLAEYHRKRDFRRTPEPRGSAAKARGKPAAGSYVIQKHDATRLHYDFRLELDGVLKSWAVPKGPSLDPAEKRLAVEVEDHPLEYGGFEGVIPRGEYGGGTVVLWDRGRWRPQGDAGKDLAAGKLKFELEGEKLSGGWNLVRLRGREGEDGRTNWLLIKEDDEQARPHSQGDVLEERPESVISGRSIDEVAARRDRVWRSGRAEKTKPARAPAKAKSGHKARVGAAPELPSEPQLATLVDEPPRGEEWLHEIKLDGYRVLARWDGERPQLFTRHALDWTDRFPAVAAALTKLPAESALLDGEIVALTADGKPSFQALQRALREGKGELTYFVFDLLHLDGRDLAVQPLRERKARLASLLAKARGTTLRYSDHVEGRGLDFHRSACKLGLEGMVSKRADAPYRPGRSRDWLKIKCGRRQEAVIGGFSEPSGTRSGLGALLLGVMEGGKLRYAGKVGTGFDAATLRDLRARLGKLERAKPPFDPAPPRAEVRGAHWVQPRLVAEVSFAEWTEDGRMRQASFQGLREDKKPAEVRREEPAEAAPPPPAKPRPAASGKKAKAGRGRGDGPAGVALTHPDRVLYPEQGLTKLDLARYYEKVADWVLPHVAGRPLSVVRCPDGSTGQCFYQKHPHQGATSPLLSVPIREDDGDEAPYLYIEDLAGLVTLVQIGALEIHPWGSRVAAVETPDRLVLDLDPDPKLPWATLVAAARLVRDRLAEHGLESWVKTTGGKGLHVCAPLSGKTSWDDLRAFAREIAEGLAREAPERFLSKASKAARAGKIFVDWLRNGRGATAVAPYSTRARAGATVATPLTWEELGRARPGRFTVETVPARLARLARDPWEGFSKARQKLPKIGSGRG